MKNEKKHTPGPWFVSGLDIEDSRGVEICCMYKDGHEDKQADINQDLIAAAPELLEALIECLSCIDQHIDDQVIGPIISNAQEVIAKAKGEL